MAEKQKVQESTKTKIVKVGLISPISRIDDLEAQHWVNIKKILQEALEEIEEFDFQLELVSSSESSTVIVSNIIQNIFDNDIVVCDASCLNPNVMFELGLRLSTKKPTILIKDTETRFIFDTGTIEHLEYPRSLHYTSIQKFKSGLASKILSTYQDYVAGKHKTFLDYFGKYNVATLQTHEIDLAGYISKQMDDLRSTLTLEINSLRDNVSKRDNVSNFGSVGSLSGLLSSEVWAERSPEKRSSGIDNALSIVVNSYIKEHSPLSVTLLMEPTVEMINDVIKKLPRNVATSLPRRELINAIKAAFSVNAI